MQMQDKGGGLQYWLGIKINFTEQIIIQSAIMINSSKSTLCCSPYLGQ